MPAIEEKGSEITLPPTSILEQGKFEFYEVSENGIIFKPTTPQGEWLKAMERITALFESSYRLHSRTMFILGDALVFGEAAYGEEYAQAIDGTRKVMQLSVKTLQNAAWVCGSIDPSRRRETLTLAHHEVVAALDDAEQEEFLAKAESENLSVSALKKLVKERHPKTKAGKTRKAVIDLKSEEGLQHAAEKVAEWFETYLESEEGKAAPLKEWTEARKKKWDALARLAKIARRMGVSR